MRYKFDSSPDFRKQLKKIKDVPLKKKIRKKTDQILENPYHYKPLRNVLKNRFRTQIGSYVLIFEVWEEEKKVLFHTFLPHDEAYKKP